MFTIIVFKIKVFFYSFILDIFSTLFKELIVVENVSFYEGQSFPPCSKSHMVNLNPEPKQIT